MSETQSQTFDRIGSASEAAELTPGDRISVTYDSRYADSENEQTMTGTVESVSDSGTGLVKVYVADDENHDRRDHYTDGAPERHIKFTLDVASLHMKNGGRWQRLSNTGAKIRTLQEDPDQ
jgi:hypothetical protein